MPAQSASQRRLFGWVGAVQKGKAKGAPAKVKSMAHKINPASVSHFATTSEKHLPQRKKTAGWSDLLGRLKQPLQSAGAGLKRWQGSAQLARENPQGFKNIIENPNFARYTGLGGSPGVQIKDMGYQTTKASLIDRLVNRGVTPARTATAVGIGVPAAATASHIHGMNSASQSAMEEIRKPLPPMAAKAPGALQQAGDWVSANPGKTILGLGIPAAALALYHLSRQKKKQNPADMGYYKTAGGDFLKRACDRVEELLQANTHHLLLKSACVLKRHQRPLTRGNLLKVAALLAHKAADHMGMPGGDMMAGNNEESALGPTSGMTGMDGGLQLGNTAPLSSSINSPQTFTGPPSDGVGFMRQSTGF